MILRGAAATAGVLVVLAAGPRTAPAQMPHLDPVPWSTPADSTSRLALIAQVDRCVDDASDWALNRLMLTAVLPAGERAAWFLRFPYLSFDTAEAGVSARWPGTVGTDQPAGWPGGRRLDGFGQIEAGVTGPAALPLLGASRYALALGLPTGQNDLYPWSSTSLPLRMLLRRNLAADRPWQLWLHGGYLLHLDAGGDRLDPAAFPNGWQLGAELAVLRGRGGSWHLTAAWEDRNTRRSLLVGAQVWFGWTADGAVGLRLARELEDQAHRPAQWYATVAWRFDSPGHRPGAEPAPE